eukprot:m.82386 g.82386  ORF g.82386 m.82386 type:complete len:210 (-) comp25513_c1_seq1:597-1226(-)
MAGTVDQSLDLTIVDDQLEIKLASSSSSVSSSSPQQPQDFDFVDDIEVLSEVHTDTPEAHATSKEGEPKPIVVTRFQARVQVHVAEKRPKPDLDSECAVDSDGDLEVVRRKYSTFDVEIPHTMATKIPEVNGLMSTCVWNVHLHVLLKTFNVATGWTTGLGRCVVNGRLHCAQPRSMGSEHRIGAWRRNRISIHRHGKVCSDSFVHGLC